MVEISNTRVGMNSQARILLIDKAIDRKERIQALKSRGYVVFPALNRDEARSRCLRGGYDLIMVHADGDQDQAAQFCDDIRSQCPQQRLILCCNGASSRDDAVSSDVPSVLRAVDSALNGNAKPADLANAA
jgi:DNA-binding NtrC family response regulator